MDIKADAFEEFSQNIVRFFGREGQAWLKELPHIIQWAIEKWSITECSMSTRLSVNFVCMGTSQEHGPVVLKIGVPHPELYSEMEALEIYGGQGVCRLFSKNKDMGAMLLERIVPGYELTSVDSQEERLAVAARVISSLPTQIRDGHRLPAYDDWLRKAFERARREDKAGDEMQKLIDEAEQTWDLVVGLDRPKLLLHGDLHQENILKDGVSGWRVIDPKGVLGPACLEPARFMENELWRVEPLKREQVARRMVSLFSGALSEAEWTIAAGVFVDKVLSTVWKLEDFIPSDVAGDIDHCRLFQRMTSELLDGNR